MCRYFANGTFQYFLWDQKKNTSTIWQKFFTEISIQMVSALDTTRHPPGFFFLVAAIRLWEKNSHKNRALLMNTFPIPMGVCLQERTLYKQKKGEVFIVDKTGVVIICK